MVFPSRTDTFGLVIIEALACGTPVAGYPVPGPLDILGETGCGLEGGPRIGGVDADLSVAMAQALEAQRDNCAAAGARYSWDRACDQFLAALVEVEPSELAA